MAIAKSIHIGLNSVDPNAYNGWDGQLNGCINDSKGLKAVADSLGFSSTLLNDSEATSSRVIQEIVAVAQTLYAGDILLVTYSGHGGQVYDANSDEPDAMDETWVLWDRELIDDELFSLWSQFNEGVRIFVLSDSCHSGTVTKQKMTEDTMAARARRRARTRTKPETPTVGAKLAEEQPQSASRVSPSSSLEIWEDRPKSLPRDVQEAVNARDREMYNTLQWIAGPVRSANISASVLLISGCQDNQLSYDGDFYGQFTGTLLQVWDNGAFQGDYQSFHREILNRMPPEQSPNYYTVGTPNLAFEKQRPFTIDPPLGDAAPVNTSLPTPVSTTRPTLKQGSYGEHVRYLQERLRELGYTVVVDSYFGSQTRAHVQDFQAANGLTADGIVGANTWAALEQPADSSTGSLPTSTTTTSPTSGLRPVLRRGHTGDDVIYLQELLQRHGFNLTVDGIFGPLTESHVRSFQRSRGLTADGVVGSQTWQALES